MQEHCSKKAESWFKENWGGKSIHNETGTQVIVTYTNHYDKKLNKCFLKEETTSFGHNTNDKFEYIINIVLADINENKIYNEYTFTKFKDFKSILNSYVIDFNNHNKISCNGRK